MLFGEIFSVLIFGVWIFFGAFFSNTDNKLFVIKILQKLHVFTLSHQLEICVGSKWKSRKANWQMKVISYCLLLTWVE
jgi:1,4-dihydroxy-2-naphthoate octaprenyltransferase